LSECNATASPHGEKSLAINHPCSFNLTTKSIDCSINILI